MAQKGNPFTEVLDEIEKMLKLIVEEGKKDRTIREGTLLSAGEEFLIMLKEKCFVTDEEWQERQKTRQMEMQACSKALAVLSSDDAHDLFKTTCNQPSPFCLSAPGQA